MARIFISAAYKSSGKTTLSIGLCAALAGRGLLVQSFKKGPDYIDPMWLSAASGRPCHNLDFYTMEPDEIIATFRQHDEDADISIIEGNKGLYDGLALDGANSNAALATLLGTPVVLIIDARGMTRGIAPLILGYQAFDSKVNIAGVILNKVGGTRHEGKLRAIIEHYTDLSVIGAIHRDPDISITERHLGLIPSFEANRVQDKIAKISEAVAAQVDLDAFLSIARQPSEIPARPLPTPALKTTAKSITPDVSIAIARDEAFGFYYASDLDALRAAGAKLIEFDTLRDSALPEADGLFIGGGFPEIHMAELEKNLAMRQSISTAIKGGLPTYAECGGLMYLAKSITWKDRYGEMVGVIPADVIMHDKPQGRGYVRLRATGKRPWSALKTEDQSEIPAHEFHYSSLENLPDDTIYAYNVTRGHGIDGQRDGIVLGNLLASYTHMRDVAGNRWAAQFVDFVRSLKTCVK